MTLSAQTRWHVTGRWVGQSRTRPCPSSGNNIRHFLTSSSRLPSANSLYHYNTTAGNAVYERVELRREWRKQHRVHNHKCIYIRAFPFIVPSLFHRLDSGSGSSHIKRKRCTSDSAIFGVKRRRTTSREQSPKPNVSSPVKGFGGEINTLDLSVCYSSLPSIACAYEPVAPKLRVSARGDISVCLRCSNTPLMY